MLINSFRYRSISTIIYALQVVSLSLVSFVGQYYSIDSFLKLFNALFTILILVIIISPWSGYKNINEIVYIKENRIKKLTIFLLIINLIIFISLFLISVFVFTFFKQINELKYSGEFMDILYAKFPLLVKGYLLAYYLHSLSYFLIVLHFYYLRKGNSKMAMYCFILSLNLVLFGLTFFSRWTIANYILVYSLAFFMFKNSIELKFIKKIRRTFVILGALLVFVFISISVSRFDKNISYANKIPVNSKIQNPTAYSLFDYLSQSHGNGMKILENYNFDTFNGQASFSSVLKLLSQYGILKEFDYSKTREKLMPDNYWTFNGLVAEWVYDFGYMLTLVIALFYFITVRKLKPVGNSISLKNAFLSILLLQIPLFTIFYSVLATLVIPMLLLIPINLYLYRKSN